jgi:hypothetical protein
MVWQKINSIILKSYDAKKVGKKIPSADEVV